MVRLFLFAVVSSVTGWLVLLAPFGSSVLVYNLPQRDYPQRASHHAQPVTYLLLLFSLWERQHGMDLGGLLPSLLYHHHHHLHLKNFSVTFPLRHHHHTTFRRAYDAPSKFWHLYFSLRVHGRCWRWFALARAGATPLFCVCAWQHAQHLSLLSLTPSPSSILL